MPYALRTQLGQGYSAAAPTEWQYVASSIRGWRGNRPVLIYCHGSGDTALTLQAKVGQKLLIEQLAQRHFVVAADIGLQAWGNDTHFARIAEAITYGRSITGGTSPVVLVAGSMGMLGALGYARTNSTNVAAVAGVIPALDIADLMGRGAAADINTAYSGEYVDATHGPTHSPVKYATTLDPEMPIHLWTSSNDTITVPSTADAFIAARPQTGRTDVGTAGHSEASVMTAIPTVIEWLRNFN